MIRKGERVREQEKGRNGETQIDITSGTKKVKSVKEYVEHKLGKVKEKVKKKHKCPTLTSSPRTF